MSHEHKLAIKRIITLCEGSRTFTKRIERIYDIALEAEGLVRSQRLEMIENLRLKIQNKIHASRLRSEK
jgi:hypothetical protein